MTPLIKERERRWRKATLSKDKRSPGNPSLEKTERRKASDGKGRKSKSQLNLLFAPCLKMGRLGAEKPVVWCLYPHAFRFLHGAAFTWYSKGSAWPCSLPPFLNHILSPGQVSEQVRGFSNDMDNRQPCFPPKYFFKEVQSQNVYRWIRSWRLCWPCRFKIFIIIIKVTVYRISVPTCVHYSAPFLYCNSLLFQEGVIFQTNCISCFSAFAALLEGFV